MIKPACALTLFAAISMSISVSILPGRCDNLSSNPRARALIVQGIDLMKSSRWTEALVPFGAAAAEDRGAVAPLASMAYCYNRLNKSQEAINMADRALKIDGDCAPALKERAEAYTARKEYDRALSDLDKALKIDDSDEYLHSKHQALLVLMGRKDEADAEKNQTRASLTYDFQSTYNKAEALYEAHKFAEAIPVFTWAFKLNDQVLPSIHDRGACYVRLGKYAEGIKDYEFCLGRDPNYVNCYYHKAVAEYCLQQPDKAAADCRYFLKETKYADANAPYAVLWAYLSERKQKHETEATAILEEGCRRLNADQWPTPIVRYMAGKESWQNVNSKADSADKQTELRTYEGMRLAMLGKKLEAENQFSWVKKNGNVEFDEYQLALTELKNLQASAGQ